MYALALNSVDKYGPEGEFPNQALYEDWRSAKSTYGIVTLLGLGGTAGGLTLVATSGTSYDFLAH